MTNHRGRLQVQGADLPSADAPHWSAPWASATPHPHSVACVALETLREACPRACLDARARAFVKARRFMDMALPHGVRGPVSQSFQNVNLPPRLETARVDIEVKAGLAFIE